MNGLRLSLTSGRAGVTMLMLLVLACGAPAAFCGEIHDAARDGDLAKVAALIKQNPALVSSKDGTGLLPLHWAAIRGRKDVAELLLTNKADVNAKDNNGVTPLHYAAANGQVDVASLLLASKADVNARDNNGETPLQETAFKGHKNVAELLLSQKADVGSKDKNADTPLHFAAFTGHGDVAALLLARGANINARDSMGQTPLHAAAFGGQRGVADLLLTNNAALDDRDNNGRTPLDLATLEGHKEAMEVLSASHGKPVTSGPAQARAGGLVIPLDIPSTPRSTRTRAEVRRLEGRPDVVVLSFDCAGCLGEMSFTGSAGVLAWNAGAEHIYRAPLRSAPSSMTLNSSEVHAGPDGEILSILRSGSALAPNLLRDWSFESDVNDPLVFRVVSGQGYVYQRGTGNVRSPSGDVISLPGSRAMSQPATSANGAGQPVASAADQSGPYSNYWQRQQVETRDILIRFKGSPVPLRKSDADLTDEQALAKAKDIRQKLLAGADFATLARAESDDLGSAVNGGRLDAFGHGQMVPAFEYAAFTTPVGGISQPVKTPFGYSIIKVESRRFIDVPTEIQTKLNADIANGALGNMKSDSSPQPRKP